MLLPEFCEELFYSKNINLFETNFKNYLEKVYDYSFLTTQKWLKGLDRNYNIKELKNLESLSIVKKQLIRIPTQIFLPNLKRFFLQTNLLKEIPSLTFLPNLEVLFLSHNQLTTISNLNIPNLQTLIICDNKLTETSKKYIKSLNIKDLWL